MLFFAQIIANTETSDIAAVFLKMIIACAVVILLAFLSIKYLLPRIGAVRRNKKSQIQIIDYQPLEPRKGIYIVLVEGKKMAIGVSENSVTKLCELVTPEKPPATMLRPGGTGGAIISDDS